MLPLILGVFIFSTVTAQPQQWTNDLLNFKACLDTIAAPLGFATWYWQDEFSNYTHVFNREYESAPIIYWRPVNVTGVSRALACANEYGVVTTARSGGHSYGGFSRGQNYGMLLDIAWLNKIDIDNNTNHAYVGTGNRIGRVMEQLVARSNQFILPASGPTVGIGGYILGGGQGVFSRKYGYASDDILAIEAVLADGTVVKASPTHYSDLFWAMRGGGGGNYAVATEYTFRTHDATQRASLRACVLPTTKLPSILPAFAELSMKQPDTVGGYLAVTSTGLIANIACLCSGDELEEYTREFASILPPHTIQIKEDTVYNIWKEITSPLYATSNDSLLDFDFQPSYQEEATNTFVKTAFLPTGVALDPQMGTELLIAMLEENVPEDTMVVANFELVGGAMQRETDIFPSAIYNRNISLLVELTIQSNSTITDTQVAWLEDTWAMAMEPYCGSGSYINLIDPRLKKAGSAYHGTNLDHLKQVANLYDPKHIFDFPMAVRRLNA